METDIQFSIESVPLAELRSHPRNYRSHPEDQIEHIMASIEKHGFYRNVVIARDSTILAGHGVVQAALRLGMERGPVRRLDIDPDDVRALEVLTGDNEVDHLGVVDDRALTKLLKEINDLDSLIGTGYDDKMLANLLYVTRPASEIRDEDEAAHWVGLPNYDDINEKNHSKIVVHFGSTEARADFADKLGIDLTDKQPSTWYPPRERDDSISLRFDG